MHMHQMLMMMHKKHGGPPPPGMFHGKHGFMMPKPHEMGPHMAHKPGPKPHKMGHQKFHPSMFHRIHHEMHGKHGGPPPPGMFHGRHGFMMPKPHEMGLHMVHQPGPKPHKIGHHKFHPSMFHRIHHEMHGKHHHMKHHRRHSASSSSSSSESEDEFPLHGNGRRSLRHHPSADMYQVMHKPHGPADHEPHELLEPGEVPSMKPHRHGPFHMMRKKHKLGPHKLHPRKFHMMHEMIHHKGHKPRGHHLMHKPEGGWPIDKMRFHKMHHHKMHEKHHHLQHRGRSCSRSSSSSSDSEDEARVQNPVRV